MNIHALMNELQMKINSEDHTPQDWNIIAHNLSNIAKRAHDRIPTAPEVERVKMSNNKDIV